MKAIWPRDAVASVGTILGLFVRLVRIADCSTFAYRPDSHPTKIGLVKFAALRALQRNFLQIKAIRALTKFLTQMNELLRVDEFHVESYLFRA